MLCSDMKAAYIVFALMTFECIMANWSEVLLFLLGFRLAYFGRRSWCWPLRLVFHFGCRSWRWPSRLVLKIIWAAEADVGLQGWCSVSCFKFLSL